MTRPASSNGRNARKRRVAVVTGTRAEYGLLESTMGAIQAHPRLILQVVVTGMHLLRRFGYTVRQIERDGWPIDARVPMQRGQDDPMDQAQGLARGVKGIADFLTQSGTDMVLVLGDRIEAMAGALAATTTGRFLAHIHGGDVAPGDMDDALRHAVTKLAHIHLPASKDAARRIVRLGEQSDHVHVIGAPGLDRLLAIAHESIRPTSRSTALIVQHAYGRSPAVEHRVMSAVLRAVRSHRLDGLVIYPNTDRGHSGITKAINEATTRTNGRAGLRAVRSIGRDQYLRTLINSRVLVGNSSSGILEAPAVGVPCVNVGSRQAGRLRAGRSVIDTGESYAQIRQAVAHALAQRPKKPATTPYGDGRAGERIAEILATTPLTDGLRHKRNSF